MTARPMIVDELDPVLERVLRVLMTVDGGCPYCRLDMLSAFNREFPEYQLEAADYFRQHRDEPNEGEDIRWPYQGATQIHRGEYGSGRERFVHFQCAICGERFKLQGQRLVNWLRGKEAMTGPYCSKTCAGKGSQLVNRTQTTHTPESIEEWKRRLTA